MSNRSGVRLLLFTLIAIVVCVVNSLAQTEDLAKQKYETGKSAFGESNWSQAIESFTSVLKLSSDPSLKVNALYFRGYAYFKLDSCLKATTDLEKMLSLVPKGTNSKQVITAQETLAECASRLKEYYAIQKLKEDNPLPLKAPKSSPSGVITFARLYKGDASVNSIVRDKADNLYLVQAIDYDGDKEWLVQQVHDSGNLGARLRLGSQLTGQPGLINNRLRILPLESSHFLICCSYVTGSSNNADFADTSVLHLLDWLPANNSLRKIAELKIGVYQRVIDILLLTDTTVLLVINSTKGGDGFSDYRGVVMECSFNGALHSKREVDFIINDASLSRDGRNILLAGTKPGTKKIPGWINKFVHNEPVCVQLSTRLTQQWRFSIKNKSAKPDEVAGEAFDVLPLQDGSTLVVTDRGDNIDRFSWPQWITKLNAKGQVVWQERANSNAILYQRDLCVELEDGRIVYALHKYEEMNQQRIWETGLAIMEPDGHWSDWQSLRRSFGMGNHGSYSPFILPFAGGFGFGFEMSPHNDSGNFFYLAKVDSLLNIY